MGLRVRRSGKINLKITILFVVFGFLSIAGVSQNIRTINIKEIPQKKIREYIVSQGFDLLNDFSSIHSTWNKAVDDYNFMEGIFYLDYKLSDVWECYTHSDPYEAWNGKFIRFGLLIIKSSNSVVYKNSSFFPEIDTGQIFFVNLKLMQGLYNMPVAFEIITVDEKQKIIEFSYIEKSTSQGKQALQFFDNGNGSTKIVHRSYFKSKSALRDDILYPYFHEKFVSDLHKNMKRIIGIDKDSFD